MKADWPICQLQDVCEFQNGYAFKNSDYVEEADDAYEVFRMGHICRGGGFNPDAPKVFFPKEKARRIERFVLQKNDILMSMTDMKASMALLGHTALLPVSDRFLLNQRVGRIVVRERERLDFRFLYYYSNSEKSVQYLRSKANSGVQVNLSTTVIKQSPVPLPPLSTQHKIASILSAYDDLIENNLRRIKILEEMAQALYREWFVKFRFPGHEKMRMVDSPLGKIPEGWEVAPLSEMCHLVMGQSPKSEFYNTDGAGLPFHQGVTDFGNRFPTDRLHCTVDNRIAERGDVLFSVRAPVGRINVSNKRIVIGRGLSAIRHRANYQWFAFHFLKEKFEEEDTMGGGTIFKAVTKKDMQGIEFIVPNDVIVVRFEELVLPMEDEIENLTKKNANLRQTRDLLLPRLISGELDVSELDIAIPEETP